MADVSDAGSEAAGAPAPSLFGDSQPPDQAPQVVAAAEHATHPFFTTGIQRGGRGKGGGRGGRGGRGAGATGAAAREPAAAAASANSASLIVPDTEERPLFGPISLKELEFAQRRYTDGAESSVWSDEEDQDERPKSKKRKKARPSTSKRKAPVDGADEDALAAAAFGGGGEDDEDDEEEDDDDEDDDGESVSQAPESSVGDAARLLPIRGETCVGCICDRQVVDVVDKFVRQNATSMTETALYKAAALHYRNEVVLPRRREGVKVLPWSWKSIQSHYVLHTCDPLLQRTAAVRSLGAVRAAAEGQLMKINADGTKQLDQKGAELLLKIVALQDKQLAALDAARMPPPPGRAK